MVPFKVSFIDQKVLNKKELLHVDRAWNKFDVCLVLYLLSLWYEWVKGITSPLEAIDAIANPYHCKTKQQEDGKHILLPCGDRVNSV